LEYRFSIRANPFFWDFLLVGWKNIFELPDYNVTVWIHYSKFCEKLEEEIISISDVSPYESTEYGG
jgi:membrane-bound acyltransferase YfiQ involved in biofilm formation